MAKKSNSGGGELNLDSLMDAVTNVVGVLMIVLVMMSVNMANNMRKILSDLPPVSPEDYAQLQKKLEETPPPPADPKEIEERKKLAEQEDKKAAEDLKTIDLTDVEQRLKVMDLDAFRKQLEDARKMRTDQKAETDKLLTEVERLKALLDETPIYKPDPPTYVRLPNPRPYPEKPLETRVLVAKQGVLYFSESEFLNPLIEGLEKSKSQLEYKEAKIDLFAGLLKEVLGDADVSRKAWADIGAFVGTFQMEDVARAWKALTDAGLPATKDVLTSLGDISLALRNKPLPLVADAVAAATKGDLTKWVGLDPSADPTKPTLTAKVAGNKVNFTYGAKAFETRNTPKDIFGFFKDLANLDGIKNRSRDKIIYDATRIRDLLMRAASNPSLTKVYGFEPKIQPGSTNLILALKPGSGGGETLEQMKQPASNYQRILRQIAGDPSGVAVFQVMSDAFDTYLEARKIADDNKVAATWEFLRGLEFNLPVRGYEVQRFAVVRAAAPGKAPAVQIKGPKRSLD